MRQASIRMRHPAAVVAGFRQSGAAWLRGAAGWGAGRSRDFKRQMPPMPREPPRQRRSAAGAPAAVQSGAAPAPADADVQAAAAEMAAPGQTAVDIAEPPAAMIDTVAPVPATAATLDPGLNMPHAASMHTAPAAAASTSTNALASALPVRAGSTPVSAAPLDAAADAKPSEGASRSAIAAAASGPHRPTPSTAANERE